MKVLIIDDEPHIRQMMRLTLEGVGYEVDEEADGEAGLDRFAQGAGYDVVVLDHRMPGLDGRETLRRIQERNSEACVLIVTAFASIELAVDAMRLGATDFLRKPMTPETLRSAIVAAMANKRAPWRPERNAEAPLGRPFAISVLTMNGFQILREPNVAIRCSSHAFRVRHIADGAEVSVTVAIDAEAAERVGRLTHRVLDPSGAFWQLQAERLLSAYLWHEGRTPPDGRLTVRDASRDDLDVAARWDEA